MRFHVRLASPADIPAMHALRMRVRENRLRNPARIGEGDYLAYVAVGSAWVAVAEGRIVGFAALDSAAASVWALFVAPEAEGKGVGRALHRTLVEGARRRGLERIQLSTEAGTRAEQFYLGAGWEPDGSNAAGEAMLRLNLRD